MTSAFLMHPLDASYVKRSWYMGAKIWASVLPNRVIEEFMRPIKPFIQSRFKVKGHDSMVVVCPLTSRQILNLSKKEVIAKLKRSCDLAYSKGAKIISLGAFSAIASDQGKDLVDKVDINVTTGRAFTIASVYEQIKRVKYDKMAIVGYKGAIGKGLCNLLGDVIKVGRDNFDELYSADLIVSTTNTTKEIIDGEKLKVNSTIIDVSKPSTISKNVNRSDVKVVYGGLIKLPHFVDIGINFDCPPNVVFACMAEPMILSLEGKFENYSIGNDISLNKVKEILSLSKKWGFEVL